MFSDPVVKTSVLAAIEPPLNAMLALDPVTVARLSELAGAVIEIRCSEPANRCFVRLENGQIRLAGFNEGTVDVVFSGTAASLTLLACSRESLFAEVEGIVITGQPELIERLQAIHREMDLDWERLIIQLFGEMPGHMVAQGVRLLGRQLQQGRQQFDQNSADYLREELQLIPSRPELDEFSSQVCQLQASVDRLSEKINTVFSSDSDASEA